jgi:NAD(P)-dependent dehydrogenase (short-subunit alcohol dehydrogenase family)
MPTAIVTGASRGIGKQVAFELARSGYDVVVAARTVDPRVGLEGTIGTTVAAIESMGGRALAVAADMAVAEDLERLVRTTVGNFGGVDLLVNNAAATSGRAWGAALVDLTREDWLKQYAVNLHAPVTLTRAVAPIMAARGGGRVLNVTTRHGKSDTEAPASLATPLAYPSSKAALDQFCISVAPQLRELGVAIINVNPGFVRTERVEAMARAGMDARTSIAMEIPAQALAYLATCDNPMSYTGMILDAEELVARLSIGANG